MTNNNLRHGNFTSSEIVALTKVAKDGKSFGAPAMTYIQETNMERRLGRSLTDEVNARPLTWGKTLEPRCFELLGLEYSLISQETIQHSNINFWAGSPDGIKEDTVIDIKCPITLKSFCNLVDPLYNGLTGMDAMNAIRDAHKDGDKYYWQIVSNAILTGSKFGELIVYVPFLSELTEIREMAEGNPAAYWIWSASDEELPYLVDGGYYKNLNIIRFEIPEEDKQLLSDRVLAAGKLLIDQSATIVQQAFDPSALLQKI